MLVINYNGNKPITDYFKFSVQGNNKSDVVRFIVSLNQGGFVFNDNYHYYAKVQCVDDNYYDKIKIDTWGVNDTLNLFTADLILKAQTTSHKQIEVSLSCENLQDEIVWQTQIVKIAIANGVNADEEIENKYPSVLQDLQDQIDELWEQGGGDGGATDVMIEKIYLRHNKPRNEIIKHDDIVELGGENSQPYCNDPTKTFVCIRTTPINSKIEHEISLGRFVIRFNYPTHDRKRGFTHHLNSHKIQLQAVVFVNANMVKTNAYGEKYIYWEENYLSFVKRFFTIENGNDLGSYLNLEKLDVVERDDVGWALYEIKNRHIGHFGYVPTITYYDDEERFFKGLTRFDLKPTLAGFGQGGFSYNSYLGHSVGKSVNDIKNNYWCPMVVNNEIFSNYYDPFIIRSFAWRFRRGQNKKKLTYYINGEDFNIFENDWHYYPMTSNMAKVMLRFMTRVSLRPSCAVIDSNYENLNDSQNCWLKTYPQSEQHINLSLNICARLVDMDYNDTITLFISRIRIGK